MQFLTHKKKALTNAPSFTSIIGQIDAAITLDMTATINKEWLCKNIASGRSELIDHVLLFLSFEPDFHHDLRQKLN